MTDEIRSICMFSNLFPPVVSGSSTQSALLARELARCGYEVTVITAQVSKTMPEYELVEGVHIYRVPALRLPRMAISLNFPWLSYTFTPGNQRRIAEIIRRHRPDIIHLHNHMFDLAFSAVRMARRFNKPLATTIHTMIKHANPFYNAILYPADRIALKRLVIRRSQALICPDVNIQKYVAEAWGRPGEPIVPYGIVVEPPPGAIIEELRAKYRLDGKRVILSLGHVHEIRNRRDLVEALPFVLEEFPNTVLLIVGAVATDTPAVTAKRLGVQDSVILAGPAPHEQVSALLALADLESHWLNQDDPAKTSLGIASLEAMGAGKAILSAANPDTYGPGVLKPGENLLIVEPGKPHELAQTITGLLHDDARRRAIGERARQTIQTHFSMDSICDQTLEVYRQAQERFTQKR